MKTLISIFVLASLLVLSSVLSAHAADSTLQQEIKPIECIYTTAETGTGENTISSCQNQNVPTVTDVVVEEGRPVISGYFDTVQTKRLRVWLNGQWFTLGIDSRLTTEGNVWMLNLSTLRQSLSGGNYVIMVETETYSGLLLRNTMAGEFKIISESIPFVPPVSSVRDDQTEDVVRTITHLPNIRSDNVMIVAPGSYNDDAPRTNTSNTFTFYDNFGTPGQVKQNHQAEFAFQVIVIASIGVAVTIPAASLYLKYFRYK